jgi:anaerobic selenocysteine-containing dehydrogenase
MSPSNTRREFLNKGLSAGFSSTLTVLAGCGAKTSVVRGVCPHDCPDGCAWLVTTRNGRAVKLEGDPNHPFTRGELCGKMNGFVNDIVYSPDRLLYPLRRVGPKGSARFERVAWDAALDDVASRLQKIITEDGPTAILPYSYLGTEGIVQSNSLDNRFFARLGASRLERNICGSAGYEGMAVTIGTMTGMLPADIVHSRLILMWGANPVITNPHLWPLVEQARKLGARVVVIDPLKSASAVQADWHVQPLPGTDAALALGMMHVIVKEGLHDRDYVDRHTSGFAKLRGRLDEYPPERVARITGLKAEEIAELGRAYARTRPAAIRTLVGMEHRANGAMIFRTIACLPGLVGAWREKGGGLLHMTYSLFDEALNMKGVTMPELENPKTRTINMVQIGRALTSRDLKPRIRSMIVYNSNPATIAPNQNLVVEGLKREDLLTVVVDHFVTDTARYADYVFPATTQMEHLDLLPSWGHNYLSLNTPALKPAGEARPNSEFFRRLASRLGFKEKYLYDSDEEVIRTALRSSHPYLKGITYERLIAEGWAPLNLPDPWIPFANGNFPTPSKKCEFYSERLLAKGMDPLPKHVPVGGAERGSAYPLTLLTPKHTRNFLNSSHAGVPASVRDEGEPQVQIHTGDAAERGIRDGEMVRVFNGRGSVKIRASVTNRTRPTVVSMPQGWWASRMGGSSANALTPDGLSDLGGGGDFHDARVQVERV